MEIPLHPGFNLIANPYTIFIDWSEIQNVNNITEAYNGTFSQSTRFEQFIGYYFFNQDNLLSLKIPFSSNSSSLDEMTPFSWLVSVVLTSDASTDNSIAFGVSKEADRELHHLDYRKPRFVNEIQSLHFDRKDWDASYTLFATDIRPPFAESESWPFEVTATPGHSARLTFSGVKEIPADFEIYLIDETEGLFVDLRRNPGYVFRPTAEQSQFTVIVGTHEEVRKHLNTVIPNKFSLGNNYPNPLNGSTVIPVLIPARSEVTLKVFNLLGQEVKTIYSGTLETGRYEYKWDGRDRFGKTVTSGLYFYRLTTPEKLLWSVR